VKRQSLPGRVDERVREAHLAHFCPGGIGLPVTTSRPVGLSLEDASAAAPDGNAADGNAARAAGERCGRCGQTVASGQDARRRVSGSWVHETCPA